MGWCSGTVVFDAMVEAILDPNADKKYAIKALIEALEDMDWDCQNESEYFKHPLVKECFIELGCSDYYYEE